MQLPSSSPSHPGRHSLHEAHCLRDTAAVSPNKEYPNHAGVDNITLKPLHKPTHAHRVCSAIQCRSYTTFVRHCTAGLQLLLDWRCKLHPGRHIHVSAGTNAVVSCSGPCSQIALGLGDWETAANTLSNRSFKPCKRARAHITSVSMCRMDVHKSLPDKCTG